MMINSFVALEYENTILVLLLVQQKRKGNTKRDDEMMEKAMAKTFLRPLSLAMHDVVVFVLKSMSTKYCTKMYSLNHSNE